MKKILLISVLLTIISQSIYCKDKGAQISIKDLPEQVPYLGSLEDNFLGNGRAGAGGTVDGVWNYLIGQPYTMRSYIKESKIELELDGKTHQLGRQMKRALGTGMFYSVTGIDGVEVCLIDYAPWNTEYVARAILIENHSDKPHSIRIKNIIQPAVEVKNVHFTFPASKAQVVKGNELLLDQEGNLCLVSCTQKGAKIITSENGYDMITEALTVEPRKTCSIAFYHQMLKKGENVSASASKIDEGNIAKDIHQCIESWNAWLKSGINLSQLKDPRIKDILESFGIMTKMMQGYDGGIMDTPRTYYLSYPRGVHLGLRGLLALGHTEESKEYLKWVHGKYLYAKAQGMFAIPNAAGVGTVEYFSGYGDQDNFSSETPGVYVLIAAEYFNHTGDLKTLKEIEGSLQYSIDAQLAVAEKNNWKLPFNNDETETGGSGIELTDTKGKWSMPSLLFCAASVDFYIDYLNKTGRQELANQYKVKVEKVKQSLDDNFWNKDKGYYDWCLYEDGTRPKLPISNYAVFPLMYQKSLNIPERAVRSALSTKKFISEKGFIGLQPNGKHNDFVGHTPGYMLYAFATLNDPLVEKAFNALLSTVGCWGMWSESYTADGIPYGTPGCGRPTWDGRIHNLRPFETGMNVDALMLYLKTQH